MTRIHTEGRIRSALTRAVTLVSRQRPWRAVTAQEAAILAAAAIVGLSAYFLMFPDVDIAVSRLFYRPDAGFTLAGNGVLRGLRKSSTVVMVLMLLGAAGRIVWRLNRGRTVRVRVRRLIFAVVALAVGPGLVVNLVFKDLWGRARPVQTDLFGGSGPFTPVWAPSDACQTNCSFVSGEGSGAAWMVGAAMVLTPVAWRPWVLPVMSVYGLALSMNRLAFGGHYLSDILLSWALTAAVMAALYQVMCGAPYRVWAPIRRGVRLLSPTG